MVLRKVPPGQLVSSRWEVAAWGGSWGWGGRACLPVEAAAGTPVGFGQLLQLLEGFVPRLCSSLLGREGGFGPAKLASSNDVAYCAGSQYHWGFPSTSVSWRLIPILKFIKKRAALWRAAYWLKLLLLLGSWEKRGRESWVPGWPSLSLALWVWRSPISSLGLVSVTLTWCDSIFPSYLLTLHSQDVFSWFSSIPGVSGTVGGGRSFRAVCQKSGLVSEIYTLLNWFP